MSFVKAGDHILVTDSVYGPTRRFCDKELTRFGIETTYYLLIGENITSLMRENTKLVFTESPGSLTFEVQDIPAITKAAKAKGAIVIMDNSWASPLYFKPFDYGVDVSVQAITKYIGGHSDLILGAVTTTKEHYTKIYQFFRDFGIRVSPTDCYTALRGLRTMATRLRQHQETALTLCKWLEKRKEVSRIFIPCTSNIPWL